MDTAFLGIALVVIVTPGPDTAVTTRNVFVGGTYFIDLGIQAFIGAFPLH